MIENARETCRINEDYFFPISTLSENGQVGKQAVFLTVCKVVASVINAKSEMRLGCKDQIIVVYFLVLISFSSLPLLHQIHKYDFFFSLNVNFL